MTIVVLGVIRVSPCQRLLIAIGEESSLPELATRATNFTRRNVTASVDLDSNNTLL